MNAEEDFLHWNVVSGDNFRSRATTPLDGRELHNSVKEWDWSETSSAKKQRISATEKSPEVQKCPGLCRVLLFKLCPKLRLLHSRSVLPYWSESRVASKRGVCNLSFHHHVLPRNMQHTIQAAQKGVSSTLIGSIVSASPFCVVILSPFFGYYVSWSTIICERKCIYLPPLPRAPPLE